MWCGSLLLSCVSLQKQQIIYTHNLFLQISDQRKCRSEDSITAAVEGSANAWPDKINPSG